MMYIAEDGTYGDAGEMVLVSTVEWTEEDYEELDEASDMERVDVAIKIAERRGPSYSVVRYGELWTVTDGKVGQ